MSLEFSTATVDDPSQLSYWHQVVSEAFVPYDVAVPRRRTEGFRGAVTAQAIGGMQVATVDADPHTVFRTPSLIRRSPQDDFLVNLAVRGSVIVTQDERDAVLRPGEFALYDSARPCRITGLDRFGLVSLKIPRALFIAYCRLPQDATATVVRGDHGVGALFSPYLRSLTRHAAELAPDVVQQVGINVLELLGAALPKGLASGDGSALPRSAQWLRARQYIAEHLADPQLSPAMVADALGVSVRYLQVLFRAEGTSPSRSIQEQRLERAARLLTDPRHARRTITDIAFGLGFKDASHFTRAFKNHYGTGPRAYRDRQSPSDPA
ncbi:helix-turn-helix domain-containing protein [Streptomyces sp. NPDC013178]|uniref:AraC-like ligand-binding domain-containing protein n=1 Tax=Streptomyces sp. NPDC013178 TaxID=3155118 RepID=UPI0033D4F401